MLPEQPAARLPEQPAARLPEQPAARPAERLQVVACVKWAALRTEVDLLHGTVHTANHGHGISESDRAAVELALRLGEAWSAGVHVVCAGPADADDSLAELYAVGVERVLRVELDPGAPSAFVAATLAAVVSEQLGADVVLCGDASADRGSGSVPAFLAHHLGASQALGLIELAVDDDVRLRAVRRLDGARRERLVVDLPAVVSVEGSVAELRRASLADRLGRRDRVVEVRSPGQHPPPDATRTRPWRPRARELAPPTGEHALERIIALTGAMSDRTPPRTVTLDPAAAAEEILDQLRVWGYLDQPATEVTTGRDVPPSDPDAAVG
jgi:electron transfer flavoprotein beta subunit